MATDSNLIKSFTCFESLSQDQVDAIAEISNSVCYSPDHVLFRQGEKGKYLYLLIDGDVQVLYQVTPSDAHIVDTVSCEDLIGCAAMVPPYTYTATQKCISEVEVLEIETESLRNLIQKDPQMGIKLQQFIIQKLNDRILHLRQKALV